MRIIHKCPDGQGSGSASPKGRAAAMLRSSGEEARREIPGGFGPDGQRRGGKELPQPKASGFYPRRSNPKLVGGEYHADRMPGWYAGSNSRAVK